jgi:hypothetical protein
MCRAADGIASDAFSPACWSYLLCGGYLLNRETLGQMWKVRTARVSQASNRSVPLAFA